MRERVVDLDKIRKLRKSKMSLETMAEKLGYQSPNGYFYLEKGRSKFSAETLAKVADILEVGIDELLVEVNSSEHIPISN